MLFGDLKPGFVIGKLTLTSSPYLKEMAKPNGKFVNLDGMVWVANTICRCGHEDIKAISHDGRDVVAVRCTNCSRIVRIHGISSELKCAISTSWYNMHERCYSGRKSWKCYEASGIKVCDEWMDVNVYAAWAIANGFAKGLSLDRIDPTKNYCPENCRFVTLEENGRRVIDYWKERAFAAETELNRWQ